MIAGSTRSKAATRTSPSGGGQPIMDVFEQEGVRFGLEAHPTEIAYDLVTTRKDTRRDRTAFRVRPQLRPEPLRASVPRLGGIRGGVRGPDLPRARQGLAQRSTVTGASSAATSTSARLSAAGTSSRRATATSITKRCSGR